MTSPPAPEPLTDFERKTARSIWYDVGREPFAMATPEQLLAFMHQAPPSIGLKVAAQLVEAQQAQARCFEAHHDDLREEWHRTAMKLSEAYDSIRELSDAILRITEPSE